MGCWVKKVDEVLTPDSGNPELLTGWFNNWFEVCGTIALELQSGNEWQ